MAVKLSVFPGINVSKVQFNKVSEDEKGEKRKCDWVWEINR